VTEPERVSMPLTASIGEVIPRFPDFRVAFVVAEDLKLLDSRPAELEGLIAGREEDARRRWAGRDLSDIPGVAAWRAAYKGFGIRKTSYRSSVERLIKRIKAGERLPAVNTLVDIYNTVSLSHVLCCGADDLDKIAPPLAFRFAKPGDTFIDMGAEPGEDPNDPPKEGEVVYADSRHVLCRRWNWRQDARTGISAVTKRGIITVQANGWGDLDPAVADLNDLLKTYCAGEVRSAIAAAGTAEVTL
jgi:DNA/RNA-binding domain of Phe-tRNA-synthetase-like protein